VCFVLSKDCDRRFPIDRHLYGKCVGSLLQHRIGQILQELGFKTKIVKVEGNDADVVVYDGKDHPILAGEILNWSTGSYMNDRRKNGIIHNLSPYSCRKVLICGAPKEEPLLDDLSLHDISILRIGYQILPRYFYDFFVELKKIDSRRIDSRETRSELKSILVNLLKSVRLKDSSHKLTNQSLVL
jgi:hypothetical protein